MKRSLSILLAAASIALIGPVLGANGETVKVGKSGDGSFVVAQTSGMERRKDRRANRQDCRQKEGLIGKDKRDCKQEGRVDDAAKDTQQAVDKTTKQVTGQ